jgi:hypothetical protein
VILDSSFNIPLGGRDVPSLFKSPSVDLANWHMCGELALTRARNWNTPQYPEMFPKLPVIS